MVATTLRLSIILTLVAACGERTPEAEAPAPAPAPAAAAEPQGDHQHGENQGDHGHGEHQGDHGHGEHQDHQCGVVGHRFEDAEKWAERFDDPDRDAWQKPAEVVEVMAIEPGSTVADIGAGTGYFMPHLSKAVGPEGEVLALDIEADMVRYMKQRAERDGLLNVAPRQVAPDDPQLGAGSVDRVLIVNTWHHIADRAGYAAKLEQALRPGGAIYIVDFTMETKKGPPPAHRIAPEKAIADLEAAGLQVELVEEELPDQYILRARAQGN
jgi:SAM-dependent methyltransferase